MTGPRRRASDDHNHPEYWTEVDHIRFEDRISREIHDLRQDVKATASSLGRLLGGIAVLIFIVNIMVTIWLKGGI